MRIPESIFADPITKTTPPQPETKRGVVDGYGYEYVGEIDGVDYGWRCDLHLKDGTSQYIYLDLPKDFPVDDIYYDSYHVAFLADSNTRRINDVAKSLGIASRLLPRNNHRRSSVEYLPLATEIIISEIEWLKRYDKLPTDISKNAAAEMVGKSPNSLRRIADKIGYNPGQQERYTKSAVRDMRIFVHTYKNAEGYISQDELRRKSGHSTRYPAQEELASIGIMPEERWAKSGELLKMTPPDSWKLLQDSNRFAGDMLTEHRICTQLHEETGLSYGWFKRRLHSRYNQLATEKLADDYKKLPHYPSYVLDELRKEAIKYLSEVNYSDELLGLLQVCEVYKTDKTSRVKKFLARNAVSNGIIEYTRSNGKKMHAKGYEESQITSLLPNFIQTVTRAIKVNQSKKIDSLDDYDYLRRQGISLDLVKAEHYKPLVELVAR